MNMENVNSRCVRFPPLLSSSALEAQLKNNIKSAMSFASRPNEILLQIASSVESETDLASFVQVNRHLYCTLISYLYRQNAKYSSGSALLHASSAGHFSASEKALQAWIDEKDSTELPTSPDHGYTPLFLAAADNHLPIVQMFLAHGVDPNVMDRGGGARLFTWPVYAAM